MKPFFILFIVLLMSICHSFAEPYRSGDPEIDRLLVNIDFVNLEKTDEYLKILAKNFSQKEAALKEMNNTFEWTLGDLTIGLLIAESAQISLEEINPTFNQYRGKGWGAIAEAVNVSTKSDAFKQIKKQLQLMAPKRDLERESHNVYRKGEKQKPQ